MNTVMKYLEWSEVDGHDKTKALPIGSTSKMIGRMLANAIIDDPENNRIAETLEDLFVVKEMGR